MLRTIVLGLFAVIGAFWSWYFYDKSTAHMRELTVRDERIHTLEEESLAKDAELERRALQIRTQGEEIERQGQEIRRLEVSLHLLKVDHRVARMEVVSQVASVDGSGEMVTTVRFIELDPDGNEIGAGVTVEVLGKKVYVEGLTIKFNDEFVELGDYLRGTSICLFTRLFGENQAPTDGYQLDPKYTHPLPYSGDDLPDPFYDDLWRKFWDYANDPNAAAEKGVRAAHGEAPFVEARPGKSYRVELRQSGGLTITPER
ncbi:MAG: hypothetical protein R3F49_21325 [Planctomycetota bacterium]